MLKTKEMQTNPVILNLIEVVVSQMGKINKKKQKEEMVNLTKNQEIIGDVQKTKQTKTKDLNLNQVLLRFNKNQVTIYF